MNRFKLNNVWFADDIMQFNCQFHEYYDRSRNISIEETKVDNKQTSNARTDGRIPLCWTTFGKLRETL